MGKKKLKTQLTKLLVKEQQKKLLAKAVTEESAKKTQPPPRKKEIYPYDEDDEILLIGEGNFSFAYSLAEKFNGGFNITATSYDSESIMKQKYTDAESIVNEFTDLCGTVLYNVDGTKLDKVHELKGKRFHKIVFMFPHVGLGIKDRDLNIKANQDLLLDFFSSAIPYLTNPKHFPQDSKPGQIHVTIKEGEPYINWNIKQIAKSTGMLKTVMSFEFNPSLYPRYSHRRTIGFQEGLSKDANEEISSDKKKSRSYIFEVIVSDDDGTNTRQPQRRKAANDVKSSQKSKKSKKH
ncbi:hypothetical protein BKA69DRAFT_623891 [Paraphysoderma sedebokerense]|nr:hypothetical protein BKA69DRAFT_623891 [Paraphysoderma sedebokerense]